MQSYHIKPKSFYDSLSDVQPSQPYSYTYGDRPVFEFAFLPNEIAEGDTLVFAVDNDMVFYDSTPSNLLHSASCMVVVRHDVTAEEATAGKVQLRIETRTVKFRDVTNGRVRPVEVVSGLYRRRGKDNDLNYVLLAKGRAFANGIIADYDALPEPITTDEYYTKGDIDGLLGEKADSATLVAHTDNSDIHVTLQDKTTWDSKADVTDIGNATVTITQGGVSRGAFSVNATDDVTIDLTGGAQADWNETDTTSPSYIQNRPSVYTKTETDGLLDAKADKASVYTKGETDAKLDAKADKTTTYTKTETNSLLDDKADKATTIAGYGITDAYTKSELATVATTGDYNDLTNRPDLTTKLDAPAVAGTVGQVLTKTADGQEWADAPAGGGGGDVPDSTDYLCFTTVDANNTVRLDKHGNHPTISLEYSTDKRSWTEYTWDGNTGATITLTNVGDRVWWRGDNTTLANDYNNYHQFIISGSIEATGNIMSLLDKKCNKNTVPAFCFTNIFNGIYYLTTAPKLPATTLANYCYSDMFSGCYNITTAPKLPATTLANYCYSGMFSGCSSLTKAPELPAIRMANYCYEKMFSDCSSLTKAPELPATSLADGCYWRMFSGCSSLTKAPELPATSLTNDCYYYMFEYCLNLNRIKVNFTNWMEYMNATNSWVSSISQTGVFECPSALDCSRIDDTHVRTGWTIVRTDSPKSITSPTTASSEATYEVSPNTPSVPVVTVTSALTLDATTTIGSGSITYAEVVLDVATGATVTAGTNMTLVDTPAEGMRNICVVRWSNGVAKLYVTIVEDLPQA